MTTLSAVSRLESESDLVAPHVVPYAWDQIRDAKNSLLRLRDSKNNKRVAPITLNGTQDILQAAYVPSECAPPANPSILCALPGDVITIMNTTHLQKSYLFFEETVAPSSSSRTKYSSSGRKDAGGTIVKPVEAPKLSKEEEKEAERRRNLNTVAVAVLPSAVPAHATTPAPTSSRQVFHRGAGNVAAAQAASAVQGALVSSIVNSAVAVYVLHDWNSQHRNITRTSVHKVAPLPAGSWKRVSITFNSAINGERLFVVLRPSTNEQQRSTLFVASRPLADASGKFLAKEVAAGSFGTADASAWVAGPPDVIWSGWLDATHPAVLDKKGNLFVYDLRNGRLSPEAVVPIQIPVGESIVTAACVGRFVSSNSTMMFLVLDGVLVHSFELSWVVVQKRPRSDSVPSTAAPSPTLRVAPFHATMTSGYRVHSVSVGQSFAHQQPLLFVALETGGVVVYHALHLEVLHQHAYRRLCREDATVVKLSFAVRERPDLQLCLLDEDIATILKAM
jgi:hypothetical protein